MLVNEVELLERRQLEGDAKVTQCEVAVEPANRLVNDVGYIFRDPYGDLRPLSCFEEIFIEG